VSEEIEALVRRAKEGDRAAVEGLVLALQDDLYKLAFRMLGLRADAQDATQEVLIKLLTHLSEFRGESAFRTWAWRIAIRHVQRFRRTKREEVASFEMIEALIAKGDEGPKPLALNDGEFALLADEVRLSCTQGMVLSLDRDHRVAWILAEIFGLDGEEAAAVLDLDPAAYRKRLSRARERLASWMGKNCGLADPANRCRCARQVPVAVAAGVASLDSPEYAGHRERAGAKAKARRLEIVKEADEIETAAFALRNTPDYAAPAAILTAIRAMLDSGRYRVFDA
jgi:RNA polymerase sigma factor (sigma-70 family)